MEGGIKRGDIWTVQLLSHPKPRPALIVSINTLNDVWPDVVVLPITTDPGPLRIAIPEDRERTGLREPSYAKCESITTLQKTRLKQRIGVLPSQSWGAVEHGMQRVLGIKGALAFSKE